MDEPPANQQHTRSATPAVTNLRRWYDLGMLLEALIRTFGYRGTLSRAWMRIAGTILAIVLLLAVILGAAGAMRMTLQAIAPSPQASAAKPFTLTGVINQLSATQWVVGQAPVTIDQQTVINGTPAVGLSAAVQGSILEDGTLRAHTITTAGQPAPSAVVLTPTSAATPASAVSVPTNAPTLAAPTVALPQEPPTSAPVVPSPTLPPAVADDPFAALHGLIDLGMADGRIQPKDGTALLKSLDEAQAAAGKGDMKKLRDRLRDMQKKIRDQVRAGKIEPNLGQQALDTIAGIATTYTVQLSDGDDDKKGDNKGDPKGDD